MGGNCIVGSITYSKVMDLRQCSLDSVPQAAGKYRLQLSLLRGSLQPGPQSPGGRKACILHRHFTAPGHLEFSTWLLLPSDLAK